MKLKKFAKNTLSIVMAFAVILFSVFCVSAEPDETSAAPEVVTEAVTEVVTEPPTEVVTEAETESVAVTEVETKTEITTEISTVPVTEGTTAHVHQWSKATCLVPKTCKDCGETEGTTGEHTYEKATCTQPEECRVCGEIRGDALGCTAGSDGNCVSGVGGQSPHRGTAGLCDRSGRGRRNQKRKVRI